MDVGASGGLTAERRRRLLQILFVFVNLGLVEAHLPGPLWLAIGAAFWIALILLSAAGSPLVCGTMCWIGAIQDFAEPIARSRVRFNPRLGRGVTLAVLLLWIPIGWWLWPNAALHDRTPLDLDPNSWQRHLFGLSLALAIPASVAVLGKRGICRYLCPFNSIVGSVRQTFGRVCKPVKAASSGCAGSAGTCRTCVHGGRQLQLSNEGRTE